MKKLIVLLLCLVMLIVLVGCNESETPSDTDKAENVTTNNNGGTTQPTTDNKGMPQKGKGFIKLVDGSVIQAVEFEFVDENTVKAKPYTNEYQINEVNYIYYIPATNIVYIRVVED